MSLKLQNAWGNNPETMSEFMRVSTSKHVAGGEGKLRSQEGLMEQRSRPNSCLGEQREKWPQ